MFKCLLRTYGNFFIVVKGGKEKEKKGKRGRKEKEKERKKGRGEGRTSENVNRSFVIDGVPYSIDYRQCSYTRL